MRDPKSLPYPHVECYLRQMDDGRWCEVTVEFKTPDYGEVTGFQITDEMPKFDRDDLIYEEKQQ